ncbi:MAG: hypothetical protein V3V18_01350 [Methylococcales bacterium]
MTKTNISIITDSKNQLPYDGELHYYPHFLAPQFADMIFQQLNTQLEVARGNVDDYGQTCHCTTPGLLVWRSKCSV